MHSEYFEIPAETMELIRKTKADGNRVFAIGTTVARTLEYAAPAIGSHPVASTPAPVQPVILNSFQDPPSPIISGEADIFIYPGYEFKLIDGLLTNFHAPSSTVLMLAAAFAGWKNLENAYQQAIKEHYAFLSYGDSMLII
jgi:S-adenosylmethionine:tRNA ribosyltransferase-isomerase